MADRPAEVEKLGIEHVPEDQRHGSPGRVFTLWFGANLTIADYVIGVLTTVYFGFTLAQAIPVLLLGNLLGGIFLGLAAAMGPSLGFPQMFSSRATFGRRGNYVPGALNWVSTVGWFTVNTILAVIALQLVLPGVNFVVAAAAYVVIQVVISVYGHDFIHLFEKVMSIVLGLLFLVIFATTLPRLGDAFAHVPAGSTGALTLGGFGLVLVVSFSYLMSWSPYASDYSRYLPQSTSKGKVFFYALFGGAVSSFAVEVVGAVVGSLTAPQTLSMGPFGGLYSFAGGLGPLAMGTLILGAFAADALNLYTNALSALVLDIKAARWKTVVAGGVVGFAFAVGIGVQFESFFENFLLALTYWIMPWLAIVLVDFYVSKRASVETVTVAPSVAWGALAAYLVSILISVPFMAPLISLPYPVGALAGVFGGADFSYFVSFVVAGFLFYVFRTRR
ncbi:MAG: cytosine permease [Thaumarchaeota archaeon]|nr:cytosine permease [Nitrososphaerota archaeon]